MMSIRGEIKKFVRDALESRGVVQGIRTVEVGLEELEQYLRNNGLDVGDLLETLMDMMKFGDLVWYYVFRRFRRIYIETTIHNMARSVSRRYDTFFMYEDSDSRLRISNSNNRNILKIMKTKEAYYLADRILFCFMEFRRLTDKEWGCLSLPTI